MAACDLEQIEQLTLEVARQTVPTRRLKTREHEIGEGRDQIAMGDAVQNERGERATLGIDDEIEMTAGQRIVQDLGKADTDIGALDHLVDQARHRALKDAREDAFALAGQPGDLGVGISVAQRPDERQLDQAIADEIEPDIDEYAAHWRVDGHQLPPWSRCVTMTKMIPLD